MAKEVMNETNNDEVEIDLGRLFKVIKQKMAFIILLTMVGILLSFVVTKLFVTKKYESSASIYLKPNVSETGTIDYNTLTANSKMVNNYVLMLQGDTLLSSVSKKLNIEDEQQIKKSISVASATDSEIITVTAKTEDAMLSKDIVETTVNLFFETMKDKLDIKNMTILDQPKVNEDAVSPSLKLNLVIGAFLGMLVSGGIIVIQFLFDKRMHTKEDVESYLEIPVLAEIPWFED